MKKLFLIVISVSFYFVPSLLFAMAMPKPHQLVLQTDSNSQAISWQVAKNLMVSPAGVDATFQIDESYDPNQPLIHVWKGEELSFVTIVDDQPGSDRFDDNFNDSFDTVAEYWDGMIKEMKKNVHGTDFKMLAEGTFTSALSSSENGLSNNTITYKAMSLIMDGEKVTQLMSLLISDKVSYWVMSVTVDGDVDYMIQSMQKMLQTATIQP